MQLPLMLAIQKMRTTMDDCLSRPRSAMSSSPLSTYLVRPSITPRQQQWDGFTSNHLRVQRRSTRLIPRTAMALVVWMLIIVPVQLAHANASAQPNQAALALGPLSQVPTPPSTTPAVTLSKAAPATPTPPSLPTISSPMAPFGTYANEYDAGQCTWYVASRRKVPSNWGNANTWYYGAETDGWAVGVTPRVGAIAWTNAGYYGHVALVEQMSSNGTQVQISEMNFYGPYIRDFRWVPTTDFRYIY